MAGSANGRSPFPGLFVAYPPARRNWGAMAPAMGFPDLPGPWNDRSGVDAADESDLFGPPIEMPENLDEMLRHFGRTGVWPGELARAADGLGETRGAGDGGDAAGGRPSGAGWDDLVARPTDPPVRVDDLVGRPDEDVSYAPWNASSDADATAGPTDGNPQLIPVAARTVAPETQQANRKAAEAALADPRVRAFLGVMRASESGDDYRKIVGGAHFDGYSAHPNIYVKSQNSTSAGAYQFNKKTWDEAASAAGLGDFTPPSQDLAAVYELKQLHALDPLLAGDVAGAMSKAARKWESFPERDDRSHTGRLRPLPPLLKAYNDKLNGGAR